MRNSQQVAGTLQLVAVAAAYVLAMLATGFSVGRFARRTRRLLPWALSVGFGVSVVFSLVTGLAVYFTAERLTFAGRCNADVLGTYACTFAELMLFQLAVLAGFSPLLIWPHLLLNALAIAAACAGWWMTRPPPPVIRPPVTSPPTTASENKRPSAETLG